ncbi:MULTISPECIES: pyridoxal-phosphate dependent enzyme [unclassified Arenibacter]|uniref:pyridoxal-phosphate dependent enzyme n=1 Tax=unclassified Arenibacter TaxID=2615047 RepID=UPI000E349C3C|nr:MULTISPECIES: pyridoxal-phosphate dependent enzyme [unclassified Arenibacter]MCM4164384.1 serine dehydratase [Arenibacter sp. A80]RFT56162.1 pyridoxal-phosphate dependent enzyme [Arenibacter sp. P308M17]
MIPNRQMVLEAGNRVAPFVHRTPVLTSRLLNELAGAEVYFKCENLQKMGAFKMRGAINAILQLSEAQKKAGVVTHSSGNFGQALALAAKNLGVNAFIVMPSSAPAVKIEAVKAYGGLVIITEPTLEARERSAVSIVAEKGAVFLHPSNDLNVIVGQGTAALELFQDQPGLEYIMGPVGGGGLIAGTALAAHYLGNNCKVVGGEPKEADDAYRAFKSGKIEYNKSVDTIADGLKTNLGDINFPIIMELVSEIIRVEEEEIISAMKLIWERMKLVIEPSSAVPFAALLKEGKKFKNKKVGIILSGGNVELTNLPF